MTATATPQTPAGKRPLFDPEIIRATFKVLIEPGAVFELRALGAKLHGSYREGIVSGYFDDTEKALLALKNIAKAKGIYVTLNPVQAALLARRCNRLDYAGKDEATSDNAIIQRCWLLIDVDPVRPAGISATKEEKEHAQHTASAIVEFLRGRGWPEPVQADSGNGVHLRYRIDLTADDAGLLQRVLALLAARFDNKHAEIDKAVHNAARIVRLYGTRACKGDNTLDRPHRLSALIELPDPLAVVSREQLEALTNELAPSVVIPAPGKPTPTVTGQSFNVDDFLQRHGIAVKGEHTNNGVRVIELAQCFRDPSHGDHGEVAVFVGADGKLGFKCHHNACAGIGWREFRQHYEPGYNTQPEPKTDGEPAAKIETALVSTAELVKMELTPREFALRPFLKAGDLGFIYAKRGDGKTWLAMLIAKAITTATNAGPWTAGKPLCVLYIDGEMPAEESKRRILALGGAGENLLWIHHEIYFERTGKTLNLADAATQQELTALLLARGVRVLLLDNLSCLFSGVKENDADSWELVLPWLLQLRRLKIAVVIVAHAGRNGLMRGTSRREDAAFWCLKLERNDSDDPQFRGLRFTSLFTKNRNALEDDCPPMEWTITSQDNGAATVTAKPISGVDLLVQWVRAGLDSATDIAAEMGISKGQVSKLAKRAERLGEIVIKGRCYRPKEDATE